MDIGFSAVITILQVMFGPWFWLIAIGGAGLASAFLFVLVKERHYVHKRLVVARLIWGQLMGIVGILTASWVLFQFSESSFGDINGATDVLVFLTVIGIGYVVGLILFYTLSGLMGKRCLATGKYIA